MYRFSHTDARRPPPFPSLCLTRLLRHSVHEACVHACKVRPSPLLSSCLFLSLLFLSLIKQMKHSVSAFERHIHIHRQTDSEEGRKTPKSRGNKASCHLEIMGSRDASLLRVSLRGNAGARQTGSLGTDAIRETHAARREGEVGPRDNAISHACLQLQLQFFSHSRLHSGSRAAAAAAVQGRYTCTWGDG